jgi:hypothetical protein
MLTATFWWSMVRRRSTVRFRKGAPGCEHFSNMGPSTSFGRVAFEWQLPCYVGARDLGVCCTVGLVQRSAFGQQVLRLALVRRMGPVLPVGAAGPAAPSPTGGPPPGGRGPPAPRSASPTPADTPAAGTGAGQAGNTPHPRWQVPHPPLHHLRIRQHHIGQLKRREPR